MISSRDRDRILGGTLALLASLLLAACPRPSNATREAPSVAPGPPGPNRALLVLPDRAVDIRTWMTAQGWESQRGNPRHFRVDASGLTMVSRGDSVAIALRCGFPRDVRQWPRLRFRFRVLEVPTGTDLAKKGGDDAAFRLYVAFDRDEGWFHPPHTVAYAWTGKYDPDRLIPSAHFKQLKYLSIGKGSPPKGEDGRPKWITLERDVAADYRRAFPGEKGPVPALVAVMLKCDSNNTETAARAEVTAIELLPPPARPDDGNGKKPARDRESD